MAQNNDNIISMKFDEPFYRKMADQNIECKILIRQ